MRLKEKRFEAGRYKRIYETAVPPLERVLRTHSLSPKEQAKLIALRQSINPLHLRNNIHNLLNKIFARPSATRDGRAEHVRLTLLPQEADLLR